MPLIDFTIPGYLLATSAIIILAIFLGINSKSNTSTCILVLSFLTILICHAIELSMADAEQVNVLAKNIVIDELFVFTSYLAFLWTDRLQIEANAKKKKGKKSERFEDKTVKDGLDFLFKKV